MAIKIKPLSKQEKAHVVSAVLSLIIPVLIFMMIGVTTIVRDKDATDKKFAQDLVISEATLADKPPLATTVDVHIGMYVESITNVDVKNNAWTTKFMIWFSWDENGWTPEQYPGSNFIVGNGTLGSKELLEDTLDGTRHYQLYRCTATVEKYYDTIRYPLDSHQLKIFIEEKRDMSEVRYVPDKENSKHSPYLTIAGYTVLRTDCGLYLNEYSSNLNDPYLSDYGFDARRTYEFVFATFVKREGFGLYLKAFLNLFGILLWVMIGLYNCAYNEGDAMGAINTGIFGAVSSMIVGMNLLSDSRSAGLVEYINFFALAMILVVTLFVIQINRFRKEKRNEVFVEAYAKSLFWFSSLGTIMTIAAVTIAAVL